MFIPHDITNGVTYHRHYVPGKALEDHKAVNLYVCEGTESDFKGGIVRLNRDFSQRKLEWIRFLRGKARFVMDFDDLMFDVPEDSPHFDEVMPKDIQEETMRAFLDEVEFVTVSNKTVGDWVRKYTDKEIRILPNYLSDIPTAPPSHEEGVVGWYGSHSHTTNLKLISGWIAGSCREFRVLGGLDHLFQGKANVKVYPWVSPDKYLQAIADLRADVILAPLEDCAFNRGKSNLRLVQAGLARQGVIASPVGEYLNVPVFAYASTEEEWKAALDRWFVLTETAKKKYRDQLFDWAQDYLVDKHIDEIAEVMGVGMPVKAAKKKIYVGGALESAFGFKVDRVFQDVGEAVRAARKDKARLLVVEHDTYIESIPDNREFDAITFPSNDRRGFYVEWFHGDDPKGIVPVEEVAYPAVLFNLVPEKFDWERRSEIPKGFKVGLAGGYRAFCGLRSGKFENAPKVDAEWIKKCVLNSFKRRPVIPFLEIMDWMHVNSSTNQDKPHIVEFGDKEAWAGIGDDEYVTFGQKQCLNFDRIKRFDKGHGVTGPVLCSLDGSYGIVNHRDWDETYNKFAEDFVYGWVVRKGDIGRLPESLADLWEFGQRFKPEFIPWPVAVMETDLEDKKKAFRQYAANNPEFDLVNGFILLPKISKGNLRVIVEECGDKYLDAMTQRSVERAWRDNGGDADVYVKVKGGIMIDDPLTLDVLASFAREYKGKLVVPKIVRADNRVQFGAFEVRNEGGRLALGNVDMGLMGNSLTCMTPRMADAAVGMVVASTDRALVETAGAFVKDPVYCGYASARINMYCGNYIEDVTKFKNFLQKSGSVSKFGSRVFEFIADDAGFTLSRGHMNRQIFTESRLVRGADKAAILACMKKGYNPVVVAGEGDECVFLHPRLPGTFKEKEVAEIERFLCK